MNRPAPKFDNIKPNPPFWEWWNSPFGCISVYNGQYRIIFMMHTLMRWLPMNLSTDYAHFLSFFHYIIYDCPSSMKIQNDDDCFVHYFVIIIFCREYVANFLHENPKMIIQSEYRCQCNAIAYFVIVIHENQLWWSQLCSATNNTSNGRTLIWKRQFPQLLHSIHWIEILYWSTNAIKKKEAIHDWPITPECTPLVMEGKDKHPPYLENRDRKPSHIPYIHI